MIDLSIKNRKKKHEMEITTDPRIVKVLQSSSMLSSNLKNLICM